MKKFLLVLLLPLLLISCATVPTTTTSDVPNLRMVDAGVYRGGQPISTNGWIFLRSLGVTNVVKLNLESEGSDDAARGLGMTVHYFPIDIWHQIAAKPNPQVISNAVAAIVPGTYFHCEHGQDRTGVIGACYRIWRDGWTKPVARHEMLQYGFHPILHGLDDFFEDDVR